MVTGQKWWFFRNAPNVNTTIAAMKSIFTDKGVPYVCQSDNGSPFQSEELKQFAKEKVIIIMLHQSGLGQMGLWGDLIAV